MSELAPNIPPFKRTLPKDAANAPVNRLVRDVLKDAVSSARAKNCETRDEYVGTVVENFFTVLGAGSVTAEVEETLKALPERYLSVMPRSETAFKYVTRADHRSFSHEAVLSPLMAFDVNGSCGRSYVGTDKLGHMFQQGHDYWVINKVIEEKQPGLGRLYAHAWGVWTEGKELGDDEIREYLGSHGLSSGDEEVARIKKDLHHFLTESELVEYLSPIPLGIIKDNKALRKLADAIGTHEKGILGLVSSGAFSYADLEANEAGFRFFLDLERDPEGLAENFDIKNYAACEWDEEVLKSKFSPKVTKKIEEAVEGKKEHYYTPGIGVSYDIFNNLLAVTTPVFYYADDNYELRLRIGGAIPLSGDGSAYHSQSEIRSEFDIVFRLKGLHNLYLSAILAVTPEGEVRQYVSAGYEIMLLGKTSFHIGWIHDTINNRSSLGLGTLILW